MRARRGVVVGWVTVAAYAALCVVAAVPELTDDSVTRGPEAVEQLLDAWRRSRTGTFVVVSDFERRSATTDAVLQSEVVLAQRPPRRMLRGFGGVDARIDDRPVLCGALPSGAPRCTQGTAGRPYAEIVDREVEVFRTYVAGADARYTLVAEDDCFYLRRVRPAPESPYGESAQLCFDEATGALSLLRVDYGTVVDSLRARTIRGSVSDLDLGPAGT